MHLKLLISVVLRRPLAMVVSTLVSVVITGLAQVLRILVLLLQLVYSCFSKLYRVGRQTSWLLWSFTLASLLSGCDVSSKIFKRLMTRSTGFIVYLICSASIPWRSGVTEFFEQIWTRYTFRFE